MEYTKNTGTDKMKNAEQAAIRSKLYDQELEGINAEYEGTPISDGYRIDLGDGQYAKLKITIFDPTKLSIEKQDTEYAEKMQKAAERAEKAEKAASERTRKMQEKADKAAKKVAEAQAQATE